MSTQSRPELGLGWGFPLRFNGHGGVAKASGEEKVRQSILVILSTAKGERVMRPEFGCDLHEFVFETFSSRTQTLVRSAVIEAIERWEPRVTDVQVEIGYDALGGRLDLSVNYRIRSTNAKDNLVFPFYLTEDA